MAHNCSAELSSLIRRQRLSNKLPLGELAAQSGVSPSHLGRIERGEHFPSAHILQKVAEPLGSDVEELFTLAGFLSPQPSITSEALLLSKMS